MTTDVGSLRRAARGIGSTVVTRGVDTVATAAFFIVVSRTLPPESFGRFVFSVALLQLGGLAARRGLDQALLVAPRGGVAQGFALRQVALSGGALSAGALLYVLLTSSDGLLGPMVLALALPLMALAQTTIAALRADGMVVVAAAAEGVSQPAAALAFAAIAAFVAPTATGFAIAYAASWAMPLLFATQLPRSVDSLDAETARHLLEVGRSMLVVALLSYTIASADVILLGLSATAAELARYSVPQKITAVFLLIHSAVSAASGPFVRDARDAPEMLKRYHAMATRWALTISLPLLVVTIGSPPVILQLFGEEYAQASGTMLVLQSFAALTYLVTGPIGVVLLCTKQAARLTRATAAHAVSVVVGVAVGSWFGATGAAVGLLIGNVAGRWVFVYAVRRLLGPPDGAVIWLLASGGVGIVVLRVVAGHLHQVAAVALGVGTAAVIAALVLHRAGDFRVLRMAFKRASPEHGSEA